jgi:hypothetical protein
LRRLEANICVVSTGASSSFSEHSMSMGPTFWVPKWYEISPLSEWNTALQFS